MNFTTGATIYQEIKNVSEFINDYQHDLDAVDRMGATSRLIQQEIEKRQKEFNTCMQERYIKKSDFEKRQLELFEKINNLKSELKSRMTEEEYNEKFPPEPLW